MIYTSPIEQLKTALYSVIIGFFIGVIYSVMRSVYASSKTLFCRGKAGTALFAAAEIAVDIVFSVFCTVTLIIFIYAANRGTVRLFMLLFALFGFVVFNALAGKRIVKAAIGTSLLIKKAAARVKKKIIRLTAPYRIRRRDRSLMRRAEKLVK